MDFPSKTSHVGKHEYRATALLLEDWADLGEYLARMLGEPASSFVAGFRVGDADVLSMLLDADSGAIVKLLSLVESKLTKHNIMELCHHMGGGLAVRDGGEWTQLTMDAQRAWWAHYRGELPGVVKLFLEAQYEGFFSGFAGMMPASVPLSKTDDSTPTRPSDDESPSS